MSPARSPVVPGLLFSLPGSSLRVETVNWSLSGCLCLVWPLECNRSSVNRVYSLNGHLGKQKPKDTSLSPIPPSLSPPITHTLSKVWCQVKMWVLQITLATWIFNSKQAGKVTVSLASIPGSGRSPGGGNGNPLQCSCLENSMDRSLVGYSPWGHKESDITEHTVPSIFKIDFPPSNKTKFSIPFILA